MTKFATPILLLLLVINIQAPAQTGSAQDPPRNATLQALKDSLLDENEEIGLLQHLLEASTVDQRILRNTGIKSWTIGNPSVRDSLFYALIQVDSSVQSEAGSEAQVLATPQNDLIEVRFGSAVFKGATLKDALSRSSDKNLYKKVADSYRYSKDVELRDPSFKLQTETEPELLSNDRMLDEFNPGVRTRGPGAFTGMVDLSLSRLAVKVGPRWGAEVRVGNDEINLPFWSNGTIAVLASYGRVKFGAVLPFKPGLTTSDLFPPFVLRGRKLSGSRGVLGEFDLGALGGMFSVTRFSKDDGSYVPDPSHFYYVSGIVQLYYSFGVALDQRNRTRAKIGFGLHRVDEANLSAVTTPDGGTDNLVKIQSQPLTISPYARVEYVNSDVIERFTASVQFYDMGLLMTAGMDIVPNILGIELKYVWPIGAELKKWQNPDFFILSPKLHITF